MLAFAPEQTLKDSNVNVAGPGIYPCYDGYFVSWWHKLATNGPNIFILDDLSTGCFGVIKPANKGIADKDVHPEVIYGDTSNDGHTGHDPGPAGHVITVLGCQVHPYQGSGS